MKKYKNFGLLVLALFFALHSWVKNVIILPSASMVV